MKTILVLVSFSLFLESLAALSLPNNAHTPIDVTKCIKILVLAS